MTYKDRLYPWCIIRHLPKSQRLVVGRLRRRNEAEDHLRILRQIMPNVAFSIIFDPMLDRADTTTTNKQITEQVLPPL